MSGVVFSLILGTATPGGGFPVYGAAYAEMLNAQEPRLRIETRNTKGSTENVPLLEAGKIDLGLVAGELASAALAKPGTQLRIVAAMYSSPGMFIVRADSPVRKIEDLRGKPVVLGTQGSGITVLGRIVLNSLGIEHQEITLEKAADGPPMLADGRAAALWGAGVGWPAFSAHRQGGRALRRPGCRGSEAHPGEESLAAGGDAAGAAAIRGRMRRSIRSGRGASCLRGRACPTSRRYLLARALHRAEEPARGAPRPGEGKHGGEHRRGFAAAGPDSSGGSEVPSGSKSSEVKAKTQYM